MAVTAKLYADDRAAIRRSVELDATVRDMESRPLDVDIEDLSATGFRMATTAELQIGSIVGIGVSGVARRDARVVRRSGRVYGCEFLAPISEADIEQALEAVTVVPAVFGGPVVEGSSDARVALPGKLPVRMRLAVIAGASALLWVGILAGILALA